MAQMIPDSPFYNVTGSPAELKIFDSLRTLLPDDWIVIHSFRWLKKENRVGGKAQGEGDFILFHPNRGILVLEVKGGDIAYHNRVWSTIDVFGIKHIIQDPEKQASDTKFEIITRLRDKSLEKCFVCHAVWFPDNKVNPKEFPLNLDSAIILDIDDLSDPLPKIDETFTYWKSRTGIRQKPLSPIETKNLINFLSPEFRLVKTLKGRCDDTNTMYVRMGTEQTRLLEVLDECQEVYITGRAGTGKTILALEKGRRDVLNGKKVLLLCYNNELATRLKETDDSLLDIYSIHGYALNYLKQYYPHRVLGFHDAPNFDYLMNEFIEVVSNTTVTFDTLIIDEAQDFRPDWISAVRNLMGKQGKYFVFYDPFQQVYSAQSEFDDTYLKIGTPITLKRNMRNTDQISRACLNIISQPVNNEVFNGINGPLPEIVFETSKDKIETRLNTILHELLFVEGINDNQVSIITLETEKTSLISQTMQVGLPEFKSVRKFKGLENDIVIIVDTSLSHLLDPVRQRLLYVALSRARVHSIILMHVDQLYKEHALKEWDCTENEVQDKIRNLIREGL